MVEISVTIDLMVYDPSRKLLRQLGPEDVHAESALQPAYIPSLCSIVMDNFIRVCKPSAGRLWVTTLLPGQRNNEKDLVVFDLLRTRISAGSSI